MKKSIDYKNFFELLEIKDIKEKEEKLKELIDKHLKNYFNNDNRRWFNEIVSQGLLNLVKYCEESIENFSLYDNSSKNDSFSNVSFLWSIRGGNIELINYFIEHKDFNKFYKRKNINEEIASHLYSNVEKWNFNEDEYGKVMKNITEKLPNCIPAVLEKNILNQHTDKLHKCLIKFIKDNEEYLKQYLLKEDEANGNNFTRFCMVSLNRENFKFAKELRQLYKDERLNDEQVSFLLFIQHKLKTLEFILQNPDFFRIEKKETNDVFTRIFSSPINSALKKEDYDFLFLLTKNRLHDVNYEEMKKAIYKNLKPFVKKYYKKFQDSSFDLSIENECTQYIKKQQTIKQYKELLITMNKSEDNSLQENKNKIKVKKI